MRTDDDAHYGLLGKVQAIRRELVGLRDREQGRGIKGRIADLRRAATAIDGVQEAWKDADLQEIVRRLQEEARAVIVLRLGMSAWDEPELQAERAARPPVASGIAVSNPAAMASPFKKPLDLTRAASACPQCGQKTQRMSHVTDGRTTTTTYHHESGNHTV